MGLHVDELHRASTDPRVPRDERWDINRELWEQFKGALEIPNQDDMREAIQPLLLGADFVGKATRLVPYAERMAVGPEITGRGHQSFLQVNEFGIVGGQSGYSRWCEPPAPGGFHFLRDVVNNVDILKAVILTRCRQILSFCQPERDGEPLGFHFIRKDGEKVSKRDKDRIDRLESWVLNCGDEIDPRRRKRMRRDDMAGFIHKHLFDSLSADSAPVEVEPTRNGRSISGIYAVPFDTVRLCTEEGYEGDDEICGVQVIDGTAHVTYTYDDLIYEVRNPRTDLYVCGYGFAEAEMVVRALTAYLNAFTYNAAGLDRNSVPRGLLFLLGEYDQRQLGRFRNNMDAMLSGAGNQWKIPVLAGSGDKAGATYVPIDNNFNEMLLAKWMTLVVSIVCAVYSIDPNEIHFDSFSSQQSSPLSGKDTSEKLAHSRDKGLLPLLKHVKRLYNTHLIPLIDPDYRLEFTGLNEEEAELKAKRLELTSTIDELRELDGRDPHPDKAIGAAPASQSHLPLYMQERQMALQQQMGGGPGAEGEDYPQTGDGEHTPYVAEGDGGEAPDADHLHTLQLEDDEEGGGAMGKAVGPAAKESRFLVIIERERHADAA